MPADLERATRKRVLALPSHLLHAAVGNRGVTERPMLVCAALLLISVIARYGSF